MEDKNNRTGVTSPGDANTLPSSSVVFDSTSFDPQALSGQPITNSALMEQPVRRRTSHRRWWALAAAAFVLFGGVGLIAFQTPKSEQARGNVSSRFDTTVLPLDGFNVEPIVNLSSTKTVVINGALTVKEGLVITPTVQPASAQVGQIYYDLNKNTLAYFNGTEFVSVGGEVVQEVGGLNGIVSLGGGLLATDGQLTNSGVLSIQGQTGNVELTAGSGIVLEGTTIVNSGIVTIASSSPSITVSNDGNGNVTLGGSGSGTISSLGGTTGRIAKFVGVQEIADSLIGEAGTTVTINGDLSVTGTTTLSSPLSVASGGTGATTLGANGVLVGNAAGAISSVVAGAPGQCLTSTLGAPAWASCGGGSGVASLNGLTGALTVANATGSVNTITINDASTSGKGIASFNSGNFSVTGGAVNTIQNIGTGATPTFAGVNTNAITPSGALAVGASGQSLNLLGNASSTFAVGGVGTTTSLGFTGTATGNVTYLLDRSAAAGSYSICTTAGNCPSSGTVSSLGGTTNRLSKFTGAQSIGDSSISDDGTTVTILGTANLAIQGGTGSFGTLAQAGTVSISDGSSHTVSIVAAALSDNRTYTLPDVGGDATLCVNAGNCIGGTGGAPNAAAYLVSSLDGTLTNERVATGSTNISLTDGGAGGPLTIATVQNPTFTTSVTTPILQSSGALIVSSAAGQTVAINAGTTIELQDSTNVTGSLDVSVALNVGSSNAFQVDSAGAITAATGITSSGMITFSDLDCTTFLNGGSLTTDTSGQLVCSDDDGGAGGAISGSGTAGTIPLFNGTQTITNSIITQSGTTITIAGDLNLSTDLSVSNGGTGASTFTTRGVLYGNGSGALQATTAGTSGQVLVADGSGVPVFVSFSGDVTVSNTGATTIQANSVALGGDTTGDFVGSLGTLTGLSTSGNSGEGSTPTLSVLYGSLANTAVQGNVTLTCPSGTGNLTGGGTSITLGTGGVCGSLSTVANPTFATSVTTPQLILDGASSNGTIEVGSLGQSTVYTLPDPVAGTVEICIATGNCSAAGTAGGDLTGTYPNPTIAKLQNTNLNISSPTAGQVLVYNGTNTSWENRSVSSDIVISETGVATIQANAAALGADTTGNYVIGLMAGTGASVTGSAGEGWSPTVAVLYGSSAGTAVEGNTSLSVTAGTNLVGGGSVTLGAGGSLTLNVTNSPVFSGTLAVQGATVTIGGAAQAGSVVLHDGSSDTVTINTSALADDRIYTIPDVGGNAEFCLNTGNCAGSGSGVTGTGTTNRLSKFTGAQSIGDSSISDDGTTVTILGTANLVIQGGTNTLGTTTQAGNLVISDGSSDSVSIVAAAMATERIYTLPDVSSDANFCLSTGNCIGGGGGGAPNDASYLLTTLNGTLTNDRALNAGSNISFTDAGANANFTVATVQNPSFTTSVTTPILQSSGALAISSAAGQTVAIDAGTTIELQDSTNVTGSLDVSIALNVGSSNAFQVNSAGAIAAATGVSSSGTITFSGLDCTAFANGGTITANGSGVLSCADDNGAAAGTITGGGTAGTIPVFDAAQNIVNSIITQSGTTINIAGDLTLDTALAVSQGGTGASSFTARGVLYGANTGAISVTAAPTAGQVLIANTSGVPTFATFTGDVAVSDIGETTIQANSVALGTDTVGNYVATLGSLTGLSTSGNTGEGSTPTLSVTYGSGANTAVQGNTTITCPSGTGNLTGGGTSITLGTGGACGNLNTIANPTFATSVTTPQLILDGSSSDGVLVVGALGQATTYTLPDPGPGGAANVCLSTGNCTAVGTAGGDLTGSYPNPTIAELQGTTLTITSVASGNILQYNGSAWVNQSISGDITLNTSGVATIANNAVTSAKINDGTIVNGDLSTGSFSNITAVGTLTGLTVTGAASLNTSGTSNTSIGNGTGTFQLTSAGLNVSTAGALTGVSGIATSGGYTQTGTSANTFTGATSFTAAGTALSVTNNATIGGTLTVNTITPNGAMTIGDDGQSLLLRGNATTAITATNGANTTTVGFAMPTADTTISFPALPSGTGYTVCTSYGNCGGVGATLQTAYDNSTAIEIELDPSQAALTIRDNSVPLTGNLFEIQNNDGSTTFFNVTSSGAEVTGEILLSGALNTTNAGIETNSIERISNGGNLVNIGTINASGSITFSTLATAGIVTNTAAGVLGTVATVPVANGGTGAATLTPNGILFGSGTSAIQATAAAANSVLVTNGSNVPSLSQTLPSTVQGNITTTGTLTSGSITSGFGAISTGNNITTTAAIQGGTAAFTGTDALTLGTANSIRGAIVFQGSTGTGTLTLAGPTTPNASNYTLTIPAITGSANLCTDNTICSGYAPASGSGSYIQNQTSQQISANFNILSAAAGSIGGLIQGASSQTAATMVLKGGTTPGANADLLQLQTSAATVARIDNAGDLLAGAASTATTGTTTGTGTATATLTLTSDPFSVNDIVFIDNAGQDFYTRITADPGTNSYTVSPAVTFETGRTVTRYTIQNIGATQTDYATQTNRFFQGYFLGGIVTGSGSTIYSDQNITSSGRLEVSTVAGNAVSGLKVETAMSAASGQQHGNILGVTINPGGSSSGSHFGTEAIVNIGTAGTTFTGDIVANLGQINWSGASNTANTGKLYGTIGKVVTASGAGSVQNTVALAGQLQYAVGTTVTNSYNVYASNLLSGATTNLYGFYAENMTGGTNNYPLYLASATPGQPLLSVTGSGATTLRNSTNSPNAFRVQNASGDNFLNIDTSNNLIQIGDDVADGTGALLILDAKNTSGDPTGVNGGMYYNVTDGKFRCYQDDVWIDCVGAGTAEYLRAENQTPQTGTDVDNVADHVKFAAVAASSGASISLDTTSAYAQGGTGASVGRFTLQPGKTYKLEAGIPWANYSAASGSLNYRWYNVTAGTGLGNSGGLTSATWSTSVSDGAFAQAVISPSVTTLVELRLVGLNFVSTIGSATNSLYPFAFIEVMSDGTQIAQFQGATDSTDGQAGFVPMPTAGQEGAFLLGDGSWSTGVRFLTGPEALVISDQAVLNVNVDQGNDTVDRYYRLGTFGATSGEFAIDGILAGHTQSEGKGMVNIKYSARDGFMVMGTAFGLINSSDIVVYYDGVSTYTVWLKTDQWALANINLKAIGASVLYDGAYQTTTPSGTLTNTLSADTGGKLFKMDNSGGLTLGASDANGSLLVLDSKTGSGDSGVPTTNGGMYYNVADGKFRCYENGAWVNCIGMDSFIARKTPFYSADFMNPTVGSYSPWSFVAMGGGTQTSNVNGDSSHPGVVAISSAGAANDGGRLFTTNNAMAFAGGESYEAIIRVVTLTNVVNRVGFHDGTGTVAPTDGCFFETSGTTLSAKCSAAGSTTTSGTTLTLTAGNWYRMRIEANSGATSVAFNVYNDSGTNLLTTSVASNIPTGSNLFGATLISHITTTTTANLTGVDYMALWWNNTRQLTR